MMPGRGLGLVLFGLGASVWAGVPALGDVPKALATVEAAGPLEAMGIPLHFRAVKSSAGPDELADYFVRQFQKAGLFIPPRDEQFKILRNPQLSAIDPERLVGYTVIFQRNADKTTTVLIGEANLKERRPPRQGSSFAPVPPAASSVIVSSGEGARTLSFQTEMAQAEIESFYRVTLTKDGYTDSGEGLFRRGHEEIQISTHQREGKLNVLVFERAATE